MPTSISSLGVFVILAATSSLLFSSPVCGFVPTIQYTSSSIMSSGTSSPTVNSNPQNKDAAAKDNKSPRRHHHSISGSPSTVLSMMEDDGYGNYNQNPTGDETNEVRVEPGTHDELMYALGVNLARQLGDIRPLVESGEELAQVAKGLLDTVVGRLNDDAQRLLLSSRGQELDDLILTRA
jgi:hypothetical protein